jgi:UDP-2,4-diacetamido-2,4,6-trideoxy-beta-L-altropyranose hydrolase
MRVAIRADACPEQGTGHVMRSLALAKSLTSKGLDVTFACSVVNVSWLSEYLEASGISITSVPKNSLLQGLIGLPKFDLVVVDSYEIASDEISALNTVVPVLAIIDGSNRGIKASIYLDQNLGSEVNSDNPWYENSLTLFGAKYALVRSEVLEFRKTQIFQRTATEHRKLLVFLGGTDPRNYILQIARLLVGTRLNSITFIAPKTVHEEIIELMQDRNCEVLEFTKQLPKLIAQFDAVISAAGTSTWDVATIGTPGGYLCVAENQKRSLIAIDKYGIGVNLGDLTKPKFSEVNFVSEIEKIIFDNELREGIWKSCRNLFDGNGSIRVSDAILEYLSQPNARR